jgi:hypothetical protein
MFKIVLNLSIINLQFLQINVSNLEPMNITFHFRGLAFIHHFTAKLRAAVKNTQELLIAKHMNAKTQLVMRRLMMRIRSEKCVVRQLHRHTNVTECWALTNFIVALCILKIHYTPTNALLYIVLSLKFTLKHLQCSYMFRSSDQHQGVYKVPC